MSKEILSTEILITEFLKSVGVESASNKLVGQIANVNSLIGIFGMTIDMDSSYFESEVVAVGNFNKRHGTHRTVDDLEDRYDMTRWSEELGIENPLQHAISFWNDPDELVKLPLTEGVPEVFGFLSKIGIKVPKVTARPSYVSEPTRRYFADHEPEATVFIQDSGGINANYKIRVITETLNYKLHIDDAPEEAEELAKHGVITSMVDQPWNKNYEAKSDFIVTQKQVFRDGLHVLDLSNENFRSLLKMVRVYLALGDKLLRDYA